MGFQLPVTDVILQFTIVVAAALVVQVTLERSRIPGIVGLLVLGMMVGPGGLAILPEEPVVELLGSIGLLYIMFLAGLEIDLDIVRSHQGESATFGLLGFSLSLVPAVGVGLLMGMEWAGALLLGAALSSHTLLSYPIIDRLGLVGHRPIVSTIGGTLLTDTLALILLAIVIQQPRDDAGILGLGWFDPLLLLAGLVTMALVVVPRLGHYVLEKSPAVPAEKALFILAVLLVLSAAADGIGTEDILGAFLAGICLNRLVQQRKELREHLEFVGRMLFIPFFFVETGMRLELEVLTGRLETWAFAALLLGVVLFGKTAAAWITGAVFGYTAMERVAMTGLALPQAAATLAVVVTGGGIGLIGEEVVDQVIIVIFLSCLMGPLVTGYAGRHLVGRRQEETRRIPPGH
jgi:Kef-type K+ transport system membrane component KefB